MKQITNIYTNDKLDPKKKVMMFTSEVCLPEILKQQDAQEKNADAETQEVFLTIQNEKDQDIIPFLCYFNGLSFLKRLPTSDEITNENQAIDLESGYKIKDSFIELRSEHKND